MLKTAIAGLFSLYPLCRCAPQRDMSHAPKDAATVDQNPIRTHAALISSVEVQLKR